MRRTAVILLVLGFVLALPGLAAADHNPPGFEPLPGQSTGINQGGIEGVEFEMVKSFITGNPQTDIDFFSRGGITYVSAGTLGLGPNNAGQNIFKLTDAKGNVSPETIEYVSGHPSSTCVLNEASALGLQHDVEATPKGAAVPIQNNLTDNKQAVVGDTQLLLDATDAGGRCHDQGELGLAGVPQGGIEIIDVTNPKNPVEIGLTSHVGQAHTVNVDPRRPNIAYVVSSDGVSVSADANDVDGDGNTTELIRENEIPGDNDRLDLDGFEVLDLASCMTAPYGTMKKGLTVEQKRKACQPEVYRYRYPNVEMALGHTNLNAVYGCHELETWPNGEMTCGGGAATIRFDLSQAFTPAGRPRGTPLPCSRRESSSVDAPPFVGVKTGAMVTDCVTDTAGNSLDIPTWLAGPTPSLTGVKYLDSAHHQGRQGNAEDITDPAYPATEDIDFNHESEYTHSRNFVISADERGGGVTPPGATCTQVGDNPVGNGGLNAYAVDRLFQTNAGDPVPSANRPDGEDPVTAWKSYARTPDGDKAIYRAPIKTGVEVTECTAHVFQQLPREGDGTMGRIFMGWYTQGTQVVDYRENPDGTFEFAQVGYFIPDNANQWTSAVFKCEVNDDGRISYYGVASDFFLANGRNAVEIYKATLPPLGAAFDDGAAAVTAPPSFCTQAAGGTTDPDPNDGVGDAGDDRDDGVGDTGDDRVPTLPTTGGGALLIPLGLTLLGASAYVGRSRRRKDTTPPPLD